MQGGYDPGPRELPGLAEPLPTAYVDQPPVEGRLDPVPVRLEVALRVDGVLHPADLLPAGVGPEADLDEVPLDPRLAGAGEHRSKPATPLQSRRPSAWRCPRRDEGLEQPARTPRPERRAPRPGARPGGRVGSPCSGRTGCRSARSGQRSRSDPAPRGSGPAPWPPPPSGGSESASSGAGARRELGRGSPAARIRRLQAQSGRARPDLRDYGSSSLDYRSMRKTGEKTLARAL